MNEIIPLILIALICLMIGFLLGLLVSSLRAEKGNNRTPDEAREPKIQDTSGDLQKAAAQPLASAHPVPAPQRASGLPVGDGLERTSQNPVSVPARPPQLDVQSRPAAPKSIAAQIDEILQEKLVSCPLDLIPIERRAIRLIELPGKDMVVMVGLDQYEGVGKVPDPGIRSLIREAVEEWEKRFPIYN